MVTPYPLSNGEMVNLPYCPFDTGDLTIFRGRTRLRQLVAIKSSRVVISDMMILQKASVSSVRLTLRPQENKIETDV